MHFSRHLVIITALSIWSSTQAGRRGVTRNLVGHVSAARVRIPAAPPTRTHPFGVGSCCKQGFEPFNATRASVARCGWTQWNNYVCRRQTCKRIPAAPPKRRTPFGCPSFWFCSGIRKDGPTEGRVKKCPVDTFSVRGRIYSLMDVPGMGVDIRLLFVAVMFDSRNIQNAN